VFTNRDNHRVISPEKQRTRPYRCFWAGTARRANGDPPVRPDVDREAFIIRACCATGILFQNYGLPSATRGEPATAKHPAAILSGGSPGWEWRAPRPHQGRCFIHPRSSRLSFSARSCLAARTTCRNVIKVGRKGYQAADAFRYSAPSPRRPAPPSTPWRTADMVKDDFFRLLDLVALQFAPRDQRKGHSAPSNAARSGIGARERKKERKELI